MIVFVKYFNLVFKFVLKQGYPVWLINFCFHLCRSFFFFNVELLRKTAEHVLVDMIQLLFARLPQFKDDTTLISSTKHVKDLSTNKITTDQHQKMSTPSFINEQDNQHLQQQQQINRKIIRLFCIFIFFRKILFYRNFAVYHRYSSHTGKYPKPKEKWQRVVILALLQFDHSALFLS